MKNDLTKFEKNLLRMINFQYDTKYNYRNLMEWSTSRLTVEKNKKQNEIIYKVSDFYVAINPDK